MNIPAMGINPQEEVWRINNMTVEIPLVKQHEGCSLNVGKVEISDCCPKCGKPRGDVYRTRSYDGSRWVACDGWKNPCGHIDYYEDCVAEAIKSKGE